MMEYKILCGVLVIGTLISGSFISPIYGAEFSLSVLSTGATSKEFTDPLYVPDGWFDVSVLDESCIGGLYDVYAFPVANSAPDSSTPPINSPLNGYKDQPSNFYQGFGGAGVGTYRIEVTQLLDITGCTLDNVLEAFIDIHDAFIPPPPPPPPPPPIEGGTGSGGGTGDVLSGSITVVRGAASSIQFYLQKSENTDGISGDTSETKNEPYSSRVVDDTNLGEEKAVCSDKKVLLVRRYELLNAPSAPVYDIELAKKLTMKIRIDRLLEKFIKRTERNEAILSVMCVLEEKRSMNGPAENTTGNSLVAFLQDSLVLAYEHE